MDVFSHNGAIKSNQDAQHSLYSIEFSYGFGVYESIRVHKQKPLFLKQHLERLLHSAAGIGLTQPYSTADIAAFIHSLVKEINEPTFNLKILLIGGRSSDLYILPMKPRFPDRSLYRKGAQAVTVDYERYLPNVKSLNMLPSYLAYRKAVSAGAYDALLVDQSGAILEGTRTNFFAIIGQKIYTAPDHDVLQGVTRTNLLKVARDGGWEVVFAAPLKAELDRYESCFVSSTSSKVMPLASIDDHAFEISKELKQLQADFNAFLKATY